MIDTKIEWTDATWNPVRGCTRVSEGCRHCYAEGIAARFSHPAQPYEGFARMDAGGHPKWTGKVELVPHRLLDPLRRRKRTTWFVNSMSDLFHGALSFSAVAAVFGVMASQPRDTFLVLTKRPEGAVKFLDRLYESADTVQLQFHPDWPRARRIRNTLRASVFAHLPDAMCKEARKLLGGLEEDPALPYANDGPWPPPNVWLGVSAEDQETADRRIPLLLQCRVAHRFLSAEPLLDRIRLQRYLDPLGDLDGAYRQQIERGMLFNSDQVDSLRRPVLEQVIVGGESGRYARPCDTEWVHHLILQCRDEKVPCFVKQLGARPAFYKEVGTAKGGSYVPMRLAHPKGGDIDQWPEKLQVRELAWEVS